MVDAMTEPMPDSMVFGHSLAHWAAQRPQACAIEFRSESAPPLRLGYCELNRLVQLAQQDLIGRGLIAGDRVAWLGWNHPALIVLVHAAARLGIAMVPLNYRLTAHELNHPLQDARPRIVWIDTHLQTLQHALATSEIACEALGMERWWQTLLDQLANASDAIPAPALQTTGHLDHDLMVVYSSGTTGKPKGAVLTQRALWFNSLNSIHAHDLVSSDRVLVALPTFHVGGLNIMLLPALQVGAQVILMDRFEPSAFLNAINETQPTLSILVPAVMRALIAHPQWLNTSLDSLRMLNAGSSIIPDDLIAAIHARGVPLGQVYGSTETAPIAIVLRAEDALRKAGSTGLPAIYCQARLVDESGPIHAAHQVGEIQIKGPNILRAYLNLPQATEQAIQQGWYATGDLAYRDHDGYYWVVGRARELIITGGENVYPAEVETLLEQHPAIAQAAVLGLPDHQWGEIVCAALVLYPDTPAPTLEELQAFMITKLARFKQPRRMFVLQALPRTALGKVQKSVLYDQLKALDQAS
jgi:fatty-acyl-CoA synthase